MKAKYVNPLLHSTANVLQMVAGVEPQKGEIKKSEGIKNNKLYTLYFTFEKGLEGFYAIGFDEEVALKMVEKMTGTVPTSLDTMGFSALKELVEMMRGNALTDLAGLGFECEATETNFSYSSEKINQPSISLTMETEFGDIENVFYVKKATS